MPRRAVKILNLAQWGLSPSALTRLGNRPVSIWIHQKGPSIRRLFPLPPAERQARVAAFLARGLKALEKRCPQGALKVRGDGVEAWTIDARIPAKTVVELSRLPSVSSVFIEKIQGLPRCGPRKDRSGWFAVREKVAVQVEGQVRGYQTVEDRIVLLKARSERHARRLAARNSKEYGEPYLNSDGYMVRWKLEEIVDVYSLSEDEIDEAGTEVYSRLGARRMRPEYEWHPRGRRSSKSS